MKNNLIFPAFCILLISQISYSQTKRPSKGIDGTYIYTDSSLLAGASLTLTKDGKYGYKIGTDVQTQHSYGKWIYKDDTLILSSSIKKGNIPITVNEKIIDSMANRLFFGIVKNLDDDIMNSIIYFNADTTSFCIPLFETGCERQVGSVDSFQVIFNNKSIHSKWIKLKNKNANRIDITANVNDVLALYLFFEDRKFLYKNGLLWPLENDKMILVKVESQK